MSKNIYWGMLATRRGRLALLLASVTATLLVVMVLHSYQGVLGSAVNPRTRIDLDALETAGRNSVSCEQVPREGLMVALVLGQSNAASHGETPRQAGRGVFSYYRGRCYQAADPLPGTTGGRGSVWTRLGDRIPAGRSFSGVMFVPIAVTSTSIAQWSMDGELQRMVRETVAGLNEKKFRITHVLWHQGEADTRLKTNHAEYKRNLEDVVGRLRSYGVKAPIYVAIATLCFGVQSSEIRAAQAAVVDGSAGVLPGPDTDVLDHRFRYDGCHFSNAGLEAAADLWRAAIGAAR